MAKHRISKPRVVCLNWGQTWKYAVVILKKFFLSLWATCNLNEEKTIEYSRWNQKKKTVFRQKNGFRGPFWIYLTTGMRFFELIFLQFATNKLKYLSLEFWKYLYWFSSYKPKTSFWWPFWNCMIKPQL